MNDTLKTLFFAEDLSYQIYFTLGRTAPVNQISKIARKRLNVISPYDNSVGQAVLRVINAHKAISDCFRDLVRDGVSDHELVCEYLIEAVPSYFDDGYTHESCIAYCSTVVGVCGMYLEGGNEEFVEVGISVISTVLLGFIINGDFQSNGGWAELIQTCIVFNECEARRLEFLDQLNQSHEEYKAKSKKKTKTSDCGIDTNTADWFPFIDPTQPSTSRAFANVWKGSAIAECETSTIVAGTDSTVPDMKADVEEPVTSTRKSKTRKRKGKSKKKDVTEDVSQEMESKEKTPTKSEIESPNKSSEYDKSMQSITDIKNTLQMFQGILKKAIPVRSSDPDPSVDTSTTSSTNHSVENKSERSDANEKTTTKRRKRKGKSGKSNNANAASETNEMSSQKDDVGTKRSIAGPQKDEIPLDNTSENASSLLKEQFESVVGDFVSKLNVSKRMGKE